MAQLVKDLALSLLWLGLLLWLGFDPWPRNVPMLWAWPKKKGGGELLGTGDLVDTHVNYDS